MNPEFEIKECFEIKNRGYFLFVKYLTLETEFEISENSKLGNVMIEKHFEIPRILDEKGQQKLDVFVFKLKYEQDRDKLLIGQIVELTS